MFRSRIRGIHFVGIGGIGMSGIAELLLNLEYQVSGSDLKESETTRRLADLGGKIFIGHDARNVADVDVVVTSSAVKSENPEVIEAKRRSIPVIPRAEMLAELMRLKYGIAVAGSHGKTTTTSIVASLLDHGALDPTVVIGGKVNSMGTNARLGQGDYFVIEADESDGSFMKFSPTIAVVTNIDAEHIDHYGDFDELKLTFLSFINKVPFYGLAVLCLDCKEIQGLLPHIERRYVTYGRSQQADYAISEIKAEGLRGSCRVTHRTSGRVLDLTLNMVGQHNLLNAVAALAVADELEIPIEKSLEALGQFGGVQRRFTIRGTKNNVTVVDDYGHHPTEIRATLSGARSAYKGHVRAVFQPHRFTRLRDHFRDFATAFYDADTVFVAPVYTAGESPIEGIDAPAIAQEMQRHGHTDVRVFDDQDQLLNELRETAEAGDLVITLGAGDIWRVGQHFLDA